MKKSITKVVLSLLILIVLLSGCRVNISIDADDYLTGEEYPNAAQYRTGAFDYAAEDIKSIEVFWRSGGVAIVQSDSPILSAAESGTTLNENTSMYYYIDNGVLRIRFCASGTKIHVNPTDKHLKLEVPEGVPLSVYTTAAPVNARNLKLSSLLVSVHSGNMTLGNITADNVDLSSSSGKITAGGVLAETVNCASSSGAVSLGRLIAQNVNVSTSSGKAELTLSDVAAANISTSSGKVAVTLENGGAELSYYTACGVFRTEKSYSRRGDLYIFNSGKCKLSVSTSSGDLEIK